jgi:hypothetical protein
MRKLFLLISCILTCSIVFSQEKTKQFYLEKAKRQNTTGWILLAAGTTAIITGIIIEAPHRGTGDSQSFAGGMLEVGGIICTLASIPFFISSSKNKKRAAALAISNRPLVYPDQKSFVLRSQPTISLTVPLKRY